MQWQSDQTTLQNLTTKSKIERKVIERCTENQEKK